MTSESDIKALVRTTIEAQIIKAFHEAPEVIDKLVQAALSQEVDEYGSRPSAGFGRGRMPYLEWQVGETIRGVARDVIKKVIEERRDEIEATIRAQLISDKLVSGLISVICGAASQDWNWDVVIKRNADSR